MKYFIPFKYKGGAVVDWDFTNPIHCLNWFVDNTGYAKSCVTYAKYKHTNTMMHRLILGFPEEIDHINGNKLDNRNSNLRSVTHHENMRNSKRSRSGKLVGTYYDKDRNNWRSIYKGNTIGRFDTEEEAHKHYMEMIQNEIHQ